mmetsp:Transcript_6622/g.18833  ORF Transcript_6622/g.18833 Transcript_6622/m.18833 type:complete len:231 (-) Transcript_6622:181-873(-)
MGPEHDASQRVLDCVARAGAHRGPEPRGRLRGRQHHRGVQLLPRQRGRGAARLRHLPPGLILRGRCGLLRHEHDRRQLLGYHLRGDDHRGPNAPLDAASRGAGPALLHRAEHGLGGAQHGPGPRRRGLDDRLPLAPELDCTNDGVPHDRVCHHRFAGGHARVGPEHGVVGKLRHLAAEGRHRLVEQLPPRQRSALLRVPALRSRRRRPAARGGRGRLRGGAKGVGVKRML